MFRKLVWKLCVEISNWIRWARQFWFSYRTLVLSVEDCRFGLSDASNTKWLILIAVEVLYETEHKVDFSNFLHSHFLFGSKVSNLTTVTSFAILNFYHRNDFFSENPYIIVGRVLLIPYTELVPYNVKIFLFEWKFVSVPALLFGELLKKFMRPCEHMKLV